MEKNKVCPHCGAKQNSSTKTCLNCGMDKTEKSRAKNATWLMKNINKVRFITFALMIILGVCAYIIEQYYFSLGKWGDILTIIAYAILALFIIFFVILMTLGNKNYDDSSEELSEYKKKHTNTFITK